MKKKFRHLYSRLVILVFAFAMPTMLTAGPADLIEVEPSASMVSFGPSIEFGEVKVTVSGPEGFEVIRTFQSDDPLAVELPARDGLYKYELRFSPVVDDETRRAFEKARQDGTPAPKVATGNRVMWGTFSIAGGQVVAPNLEESPSGDSPVPGVRNKSLDPEALGKEAAFGDLYVYNSLCVGFDCINGGETFGADTIRMKENNLRIHAEDTSGGSFPTTDWRLEFNSNLNGGASYFRVIDATASRNIMTVEANAPSNSLYVESSGEVGIGTANPLLELHAVSGDTPGLRLEQDTSSGFGAQVWDLAGNETSFFVRDATNGSTLPFRIFPGSASSSLVVRDSNVGVGTTSPSDPLHVFRSTTGAKDMLHLENNGPTRFLLTNNSVNAEWRFNADNGSDLRIAENNTNGAVEFLLTDTGDLTISGNLVTGGAGACNPGPCDGTFTDQYDLETIEEHAEYMWTKRHLWGVGPTPEGAPINVTKKVTGMLHELEKAHIYIEQLHQRLQTLEARLEEKNAEE